MRMIATLLEPDEGEILLDGKNIQDDSMLIKKRLGFMPENNPLYPDMLVSEYLDFVAQSRLLKDNDKRKSIDKAVKETGIAEVYNKPISDLSKGYKQRVGLAQAILHTPDILILDEPTEGLDPNQRVEIRKLIKELGKERTVILSTHVMQEVTATCDRVIIINKGKIVADGTVDELSQRAQGKSVIILGTEGLENTDSLKSLSGVESVEQKDKKDSKATYELTVSGDKDLRLDIFDLAKRDNWRIFELHKESRSLEDVFRELTIDQPKQADKE